jgi:G2/mitotic-specific cyclin 3/4
MANTNTAAGFRGPAKRAAFGDMTNVSKQAVYTRDEGKSMKIYTSNGVNNSHGGAPLNKENAVYSKDSFSRPAQRLPNISSTRTVLENKSSDANKKTSRNNVQETYARKDTHNATKAPAPSAQNAPALQPRHYKSQPHLKSQQQQASLRRTQSKQLEKIVPKADVELGSKSSNPAVMSLQEADYPYDQGAYLDSMYLPIETGVDLDMLQKEEYPESHIKLPEISEEEPIVPISYDASVPAMSEPEECWEEADDEDFDDQDQAYTTAHSARSRDMTAGGATEIVPLPRVTARVQRELEDAREEVERTRTRDEVEEELWDVSMVAEYGDEIFEYMRELEVKSYFVCTLIPILTMFADQDASKRALHG